MSNRKFVHLRFSIWGIIFLIPFFAFSQNFNEPLNQSFSFELNRRIIQSDKIIHSTFKPILQSHTAILDEKNDIPTTLGIVKVNKSFVFRKLFYEHFVTLDTGKIRLTIDPLFNFEFGKEFEAADDRGEINYYKNTRGFNVKLKLGDKINIESSFRENQAVLPNYLNLRTKTTGVAYGQGRTKTFKDQGYDFAMASSYLSYSPSSRVNIQVGHGKHFVGNGHRSLLLSDLAFNYPYLRLNTNWANNKIQYQNVYALFQNLNRLERGNAAEALFERKQGAFHYIEYSPNPKVSIGLFEGAVFPSLDSTGNIKVGANYWVPVIGLNSIIESNKDEGNTKLGTNFLYNIHPNVQAYNQFSTYSLSFNELNYLFGLKYYPHLNFMIQAEFSSVNANSKNLFNHYNESLSVPISEEHNEFTGILQYKNKRWLSRGALTTISLAKSQINYLDLRQSFIVNPSFNFALSVGVQARKIMNKKNSTNSLINTQNSTFVYLGLSTNLQNLYFNY